MYIAEMIEIRWNSPRATIVTRNLADAARITMDEITEQSLSEQIVEIPHEFQIELNRLVIVNHRFTMGEITRAENEEHDQLEIALANDDYEVLASALSQMAYDYENFRQAANQLALVGLVTRLSHWVEEFVKKVPVEHKKASESSLINKMDGLNCSLGDGPMPLKEFEDLVYVRDSIIHADSQATWMDHKNKRRAVADRYCDSYGRVNISEQQLEEATNKMVRQVSWYDHQSLGLIKAT